MKKVLDWGLFVLPYERNQFHSGRLRDDLWGSGVRAHKTQLGVYVTVLDGTWNGMELGVMGCMTVED